MGEIRKRRLGRTNLLVTEVGLGAMDTPQGEGEATIHAALDAGISFVDTAREYQASEFIIGQVTRARQETEFYISTKTFSRTRDGTQHDVDRSLRMLGVDKIDLYQLHDVSTPQAWEQVMQEGGGLEGLQIAQFRELIDYIGVSCHNPEIAEKAITCGEFDAVMLEYSAFHHEDTERLIPLAKEHDVGVIVMRPLGGSGRTSGMRTRMASPEKRATVTPRMLLRYVLSNPDISVAIPGARYPSRIHDNVELALSYEPMDESEKRACEAEAQEFTYAT